MSDKGIDLKIDECKILQTMNEMCAESLPPDLHDSWEEIKAFLIDTRSQLDPLSPTFGDVAAIIKQLYTPITPNAELTGDGQAQLDRRPG